MVVIAKNEKLLMTSANTAILRSMKCMKEKKLQTAPEKTEEVEIYRRKSLKQLGLWLDTKDTYREHIDKTVEKAEKTMIALASLIPNIKVLRPSKRSVFVRVVHSQFLYAAPIWHEAMKNKKPSRKLYRIQKVMEIRVYTGSRIILAEGAGVIAQIPPIEFLAKERKEKYDGIDPKHCAEKLMRRWQGRWTNGKHGHWTWRLIPDIRPWLNQKHGEVNYYLTQAFSGHGCFME
ncbi:uncharacterized protein LOC117169815 [Belonocnema kinseyi]|uniref:uncharacterized protein LOC117169815 n=1 Tax=Belonocnema kinseyi TaxID=2817044 RepID=UPI00143DB18B|nr:uncharacterized protein LOC117169815 [Belonocnema kinseyi]